MNTKGRAVLPAYLDTDALNVACPHCAAQAGEPCAKADGRVSRVPCVDRLAAADLRPSSVPAAVTSGPVDFSEPRHSQEADQ